MQPSPEGEHVGDLSPRRGAERLDQSPEGGEDIGDVVLGRGSCLYLDVRLPEETMSEAGPEPSRIPHPYLPNGRVSVDWAELPTDS